MTDLVRKVTLGRTEAAQLPSFKSGDTVSVSVKVKEGEKERIQIFKGVVLKVQGSGMGRSFTVRKMSSGIGVERTFPFQSPAIAKVEVHSHGKVRQSRIFYLRKLRGKAARIQSDMVIGGKAPKADAAKKDATK